MQDNYYFSQDKPNPRVNVQICMYVAGVCACLVVCIIATDTDYYYILYNS